ncbi:SDR family NAD(P)-dependent oxidoreductase [Rheinheimera sp.]|jgi:short-subunit dehydrogenase|uniref:SDR family NAD(P)-dependent oxidoreductase n=1 Tax=Rheinheimera sp. TaxID=1869214 RepID=UPI003D2BED03
MQTQSVCLVTGASSGLGRAIALQFARSGWQVVALARSQGLLEQLRREHAGIDILPVDLTDSAQLAAATAELSARYGRLDQVILNAGTCEYVEAENLDLGAFERTFCLNVQAVVACTKAWLPLLQVSTMPRLAIVSSLAHLFPFGRAEAYGASKAAISYFTDSLRVDLADTPVQVSLIEPGFVDTPLTQKNDFPMPFLLSSTDAASRIYRALALGKLRLQFPLRLTLSLKFLNLLPYGLRQKLAARMARQAARGASQ